MLKLIFLFIFCIVFAINGKTQSSLVAATGISIDVNNNAYTFYHIPVTLEWMGNVKKSFLLKLDYDIPFHATVTDYAYTLNNSLPASIALRKKIIPYIFDISIGWRIHLFTNKQNNKFYLDLLPIGLSNQNIHVVYSGYDKNNYSILNPDESLNKGGFFISAGFVYSAHLKGNNLMVMLYLQSPPATRRGDYAVSYRFCAPLQLTVGYDFLSLKKRK